MVGEDQADAAHGTISHVPPPAQGLFGKGVGAWVPVGGLGVGRPSCGEALRAGRRPFQVLDVLCSD